MLLLPTVRLPRVRHALWETAGRPILFHANFRNQRRTCALFARFARNGQGALGRLDCRLTALMSRFHLSWLLQVSSFPRWAKVWRRSADREPRMLRPGRINASTDRGAKSQIVTLSVNAGPCAHPRATLRILARQGSPTRMAPRRSKAQSVAARRIRAFARRGKTIHGTARVTVPAFPFLAACRAINPTAAAASAALLPFSRNPNVSPPARPMIPRRSSAPTARCP